MTMLSSSQCKHFAHVLLYLSRLCNQGRNDGHGIRAGFQRLASVREVDSSDGHQGQRADNRSNFIQGAESDRWVGVRFGGGPEDWAERDVIYRQACRESRLPEIVS